MKKKKQKINDARTSEKLPRITRRKAYVLRKSRYLLRGRSNTKEREIQAKVFKSLSNRYLATRSIISFLQSSTTVTNSCISTAAVPPSLVSSK